MLESEPPEPLLQVGDRLAGVALTKWQEIFPCRYRPSTAHGHGLRGTSIISDIVGDDRQGPVARALRPSVAVACQRRGSNSDRICDLLLAPTIRACVSPFLNSSKVGMLITWNR